MTRTAIKAADQIDTMIVASDHSAGERAARWGAFVIFCLVAGVGAVGAAYVVGTATSSIARPSSTTGIGLRIITILTVIGVAGYFAERAVGCVVGQFRSIARRA